MMTINRAIEILDQVAAINEACRMGRKALERQKPLKATPQKGGGWTCKNCGAPLTIGVKYCCNCGQGVMWE